MSEEELLHYAAKAVGYTLVDHYDVNNRYWPWCVELGDYWCPSAISGDALRLLVHLRLEPRFLDMDNLYGPPRITFHNTSGFIQLVDDDGVEAAMRLAITRAAAEIGKAKGNDV
jgi:hypothetical protein